MIRTPHFYGQFALFLGKALTFSLNSTRLIRTPRYYGQFFCFVPRESPYIFSKFNPFYTDTPLSRPVFKFCFVPEESPNIFSKFDQLVITDSFFALSLGKALTFSLNSTRFIRTPRYHGQFSSFALSLRKARTFSLNSTTSLLRTVFLLCPLGKPLHFL